MFLAFFLFFLVWPTSRQQMFWKLPKIINVLVFFLFYFILVHVYLALIDELRLHGFNFRPDNLKNILHITRLT